MVFLAIASTVCGDEINAMNTAAGAGCHQEVKKVRNDAKLEDEALRTKFSLDLDLVTEDKDDARIAELMQFSAVECKLVLCVFSGAYYY